MTDDLTDLERAVLEEILSGDEPALVALREQLASCRVTRREVSGVGFFTDLTVDPDAPPASVEDGDLGDGGLHARIPGLDDDAGFVLFVRDGFLHMLEGYTFGEPWPDSVEGFALRRVEVD